MLLRVEHKEPCTTKQNTQFSITHSFWAATHYTRTRFTTVTAVFAAHYKYT